MSDAEAQLRAWRERLEYPESGKPTSNDMKEALLYHLASAMLLIAPPKMADAISELIRELELVNLREIDARYD